MASPMRNVLENFEISPPIASVQATTLPLTFLDIPWLLFSPTQPLFFYDFPHSNSHFRDSILPALKTSLSLALQYYFPLAGNLVTPPRPARPFLSCSGGDFVVLTVSESAGNFHGLSGHHQRDAVDFHRLVPEFPAAAHSSPLLAVQITLFAQNGISIGFSLRNVASDERTFDQFLKTWAAIFKVGIELHRPVLSKSVPIYDRSAIQDSGGVYPILLEEWWRFRDSHSLTGPGPDDPMVRATFTMGRPEMEIIKSWILIRSKKLFGSTHLLLSPYVLTCAYLWFCLMKTTGSGSNVHKPIEQTELRYFGFIAGGLTRLDYPVPRSYVGNCVAFGRATARQNELTGDNGVLFAAKAIGDTIKKLDEDVLGGAENWISDWSVFSGPGPHVMVTGSPKVDLYGLDFGWGRPKKIEDISIDRTHAVSLCESRDIIGGIEIGLTLPKPKMDAFASLFNEGLKSLL
nr:anthocyanin 5-aromatic acyltransferase-like [Ipomoea batatas]